MATPNSLSVLMRNRRPLSAGRRSVHARHKPTILDVVLDGPVCGVTDNKGAYDVVRNPGATKRTVHFDRWLHFARELYLHNAIKIFLTTTDNMMADMFTKADHLPTLPCVRDESFQRQSGFSEKLRGCFQATAHPWEYEMFSIYLIR